MSLFSHHKHRRLTILHILATGQTLVKAFDKISHEKYVLGAIIGFLGLIMLFYTVFHTRIEQRRPMVLPLFFWFEAIVMGIVAYLSIDKGYFYLYVVSSFLYFLLGIRFFVLINNKLKARRTVE